MLQIVALWRLRLLSNILDAESENSVEVSLNRPLDKPRVSKTKKSCKLEKMKKIFL